MKISTYFDPKQKKWTDSTTARLPKHDLYFGTPVNHPTAGIPLGDGDTGALLWFEKDAIHIHINKNDLWQDQPPGCTWDDRCYCSGWEENLTCVKHGGEIVVRFSEPLFEYLYQQKHDCRLSLSDATAYLQNETPFGSVNLRAFADAGTNVTVLRCQLTSEDGTAPELNLSRWGSRTLWRWYCQQKFVPEVGLDGTQSFAEHDRLYITQDLGTTKFCIGLCVTTDTFIDRSVRKNRHTASICLPCEKSHDFSLFFTVRIADTTQEAKELCDEALDAALEIGEEELHLDHKKAWADFWNTSKIEIEDDYLENIYYLYYYIMNSESRGAYPPHFTSGLWGFYHDYVPWVYYFHYNLQHMYAPLDAAGHGALAQNYYDLRRNSLSMAYLYAELVKKRKGAFFHDVTDRYGRGADYDSNNCTPASQMAMQMWQHWRYTGDEAFLKDYALPMMQGASEFYLDILQKESDGLYHLHGTTAYEGNEPTDDTLTDLVMIRTLFTAFLPYAQGEIKAQLADVLEHLPEPMFADLLLEEDWDGESFLFGLGKGKPPVGEKKVFSIGYRNGVPVRKMYGNPECKVRGYGFPDIELSFLYPAGLLGLKNKGDACFDALINQLMLHQKSEETGHWNMLPIYLARMGMATEFIENARGMLAGNQGFINGFNAEIAEPGSIAEAPPTWYKITNTETREITRLRTDAFIHFDFETGPILAQAINDSLLQSHEGIIRICPAVEDTAACFFRLFAQGGFAVTAQKNADGFVVTIENNRGEECFIAPVKGHEDKPVFAYLATENTDFVSVELEKQTKYNEVVYICNLFKKNSTLLLSTVCMDDLLTTQAITDQPNEDMKTLATVALGSPHLMRKEKKENDHA